MTKTQIQRNKKFIKVLRSGKYKQARNSLRTKHGYCCLGVACEVFRNATKRGYWIWNSTYGEFEFKSGKERDQKTPPHFVKDWFGWKSESPTLKLRHTRAQATTLNDAGSRFKYIADAFERTLKAGDL